MSLPSTCSACSWVSRQLGSEAPCPWHVGGDWSFPLNRCEPVGLVGPRPIVDQPWPFPPSSWAYDANAPEVRRDLVAARAKLAEGGQPDGFTLQLLAHPPGQRTAQLVQAQAKEIGIDVQIQPREAGAMFADVQAGRGE